MNVLKRTYIWCKRFRYRKGYGVHSPFAFNLITDVINERRPYYAYHDLQTVLREADLELPHYSRRIDRLLFRLVNRFRPRYVLEVGTGAGISLHYLAAGRCDAQCVSLCGEHPARSVTDLTDRCKNGALLIGDEQTALEGALIQLPRIDLLHVAHTENYREVVERCMSRADKNSLFVIEGIYSDVDKRAWWKELQADERTGITFDLYELGLVFFDKELYKQHYVVNF